MLFFTWLILFLGLPYVYFLIGILGYFLLNELLKLIEPEKQGLTILFYSCLAPLYMCICFTNNYFLIYQVEVVSIIFCSVVFLVSLIHFRSVFNSSAYIYVFTSICLFYLFLSSDFLSENYSFIYFFASIIIITDTAGYIFGKILKGPRPFKRLSPNKTLSGYFGGLSMSLLLGVCWPLHYELGRYVLIVSAMVFCLSVQAGDLLESGLKRRLKVKDSGSIFPGHRGFLDRFDGFIASVFGLYGISFLYE